MMTTTLKLSDLAGPDAAGWSDVAVFVYPDTSKGDPFTIEERDGKLLIRTMNGRTSIDPYWAAHPVRRLGRGRLEPEHIMMEGESVPDLAAHNRLLRDALLLAVPMLPPGSIERREAVAALTATAATPTEDRR